MKLEDYIKILQTKLVKEGNVEVCIKHEGNYACGYFADIYESPYIEDIQVNGAYEWKDGEYVDVDPDIRKFLVLGNSDQWC